MRLRSVLQIIVPAVLFAVTAHATVLYNVSLNTAGLAGHPAGPFSLSFQLTDGLGTGDANNTATLSSFNFGGGTASGSPVTMNGATGNANSTVTLTDSSFLNSFVQSFTPGATLSFLLELTTNIDAGPQPDQFSFAILDSSGVEIPTQGLTSVGSDVLVQIDINSVSPAAQSFGTDPLRLPAAGGGPLSIASPVVTDVTIPEPSSLALLGIGILLVSALKRSR